MRRLLVLGVVAAAAALVPHLAMAGNQEVAEHIAATLEESGQLYGSNLGVRYQNGVVWLKGEVCSQEQKEAAAKLVFQTPGVVRVVNQLAIGEDVLSKLQQAPGSIQPEHHPQSSQAWSGPSRNIPLVAAKPTQLPQPKPAQPKPMQTASKAHENIVVPASALELESRPAAEHRVAPIVDIALPEPTPAPVTIASTHVEEAATQAPQPMPRTQAEATLQEMPAAQPVMMRQPVRMAYANPQGQPTPAPQAAPQYVAPVANQVAPVRYDQATLPNYAWPSYAAYPNYGALTYPKQYSPAAWPYIGPYYPYPQVPLGWRKVTMEWHDGWWYLDFNDGSCKNPFSGFFRPFQRR